MAVSPGAPAAPHLPLGYMQAHDKMSELRGWTQPILYCKPLLKSISYPFQQELTPTPQKHSLKQTERQPAYSFYNNDNTESRLRGILKVKDFNSSA